MSCRFRSRLQSSYWFVVEGNSCDSTNDQLEAVSPQRVPHLLGFMCQHPCKRHKEMEGGRRTEGKGVEGEVVVV